MATAYTPVNVSRGAGADLTAAGDAVAATGDTFPPGDNIYLRVKNAGASPTQVSVITAAHNAGPRGTFLAPLVLVPDVAITTGDRLFGPFPADTFADPADGLVHVAYTQIGSVTAKVYRMGS